LTRFLPVDWTYKVFSDCKNAVGGASLFKKEDLYYLPTSNMPIDIVGYPRTFREKIGWIRLLPTINESLRTIQREKPDWIVLNGYLNIHYAPFLIRRFKILLIAREILRLTFYEKPIVLYILKNCLTHIVCISAQEKKQLEVMGIVHNVSIIYNSNDTAIQGDEPPSWRVDVEDSKVMVFGIMGRVFRFKGQQDVIEAARKYGELFRKRKIQFHLWGDTDALDKLVQMYGLTDLIRLKGWTDNIDQAMKGSAVILRTDRTGSPWGRDIVEAMSWGRPVIATGTHDEFVKPGVTGELFPVGDIDLMVRHILEMADNEEKRKEYGLRAFVFAKENFCPLKNSKKIVSLLNGH